MKPGKRKTGKAPRYDWTQHWAAIDLPLIATSPAVYADLEALVKTGLFGGSVEEVAEELIRAKVRELVIEGWLKR